MDDALQGFDDEEAGDGRDEMEAEIELPAEGTVDRSERRPVEGAHGSGQAAHSQEQEAGSGRPFAGRSL